MMLHPDLAVPWRVCHEMLAARGYTITHADAAAQTLVAAPTAAAPAGASPIHVFFSTDPKFNNKVAQRYYYLIATQHLAHCILVHAGAITSAVRATLDSFYGVRVELFPLADLAFNVTTHVLVPRHRRVPKDPDETEYNKFPVLRTTDPVARFYGYVPNDLVEITRADGTLAYRIVK
jgi:DNA-directed RNA polymerase subunit H (RpoH/RPB5)